MDGWHGSVHGWIGERGSCSVGNASAMRSSACLQSPLARDGAVMVGVGQGGSAKSRGRWTGRFSLKLLKLRGEKLARDVGRDERRGWLREGGRGTGCCPRWPTKDWPTTDCSPKDWPPKDWPPKGLPTTDCSHGAQTPAVPSQLALPMLSSQACLSLCPHLGALVEERVPHPRRCLRGQAGAEQAEEPVCRGAARQQAGARQAAGRGKQQHVGRLPHSQAGRRQGRLDSLPLPPSSLPLPLPPPLAHL